MSKYVEFFSLVVVVAVVFYCAFEGYRIGKMANECYDKNSENVICHVMGSTSSLWWGFAGVSVLVMYCCLLVCFHIDRRTEELGKFVDHQLKKGEGVE